MLEKIQETLRLIKRCISATFWNNMCCSEVMLIENSEKLFLQLEFKVHLCGCHIYLFSKRQTAKTVHLKSMLSLCVFFLSPLGYILTPAVKVVTHTQFKFPLLLTG